jgi:hypothetical protein
VPVVQWHSLTVVGSQSEDAVGQDHGRRQQEPVGQPSLMGSRREMIFLGVYDPKGTKIRDRSRCQLLFRSMLFEAGSYIV